MRCRCDLTGLALPGCGRGRGLGWRHGRRRRDGRFCRRRWRRNGLRRWRQRWRRLGDDARLALSLHPGGATRNADARLAAAGPDLIGPATVPRRVRRDDRTGAATLHAPFAVSAQPLRALRHSDAHLPRVRPGLRRPAAVARGVRRDGLTFGTGRLASLTLGARSRRALRDAHADRSGPGPRLPGPATVPRGVDIANLSGRAGRCLGGRNLGSYDNDDSDDIGPHAPLLVGVMTSSTRVIPPIMPSDPRGAKSHGDGGLSRCWCGTGRSAGRSRRPRAERDGSRPRLAPAGLALPWMRLRASRGPAPRGRGSPRGKRR